MSRIFLSHSSQDNFEAIAVRDWLGMEGWDDVFLDLDPERGIAAGERWERALHQAAQRCEAVIFLISPNWVKSGWCRKEYGLARSLNKRLFAAVVDRDMSINDVLPEFRDTWQVVNLASGQDPQIFRVELRDSYHEKHIILSREGLRRLRRGLDKAGLNPLFFAWPPANEPLRTPYRGLSPLEAADAGIFFGRDAPIVEATDRIRGLVAGAAPRLLVLLGASGAGKSSFLRAGLLPRLARDDRNFVCLPPLRPEGAALGGESGLLGALKTTHPDSARADLRAAIREGASGVRKLLRDLAATAAAHRADTEHEDVATPTIVVAVDQAEELFRPAGAAEGAALLTLLRDLALEDDPRVLVIFSIRSDSFDSLEHAKALEGLPQSTLALLPMPRGAYKEVIEGPAKRVVQSGGRLTIEPQLTERLLEDIESGSGSDALPLLAFTLEQLFMEYRRGGVLRLSDYQEFGELKGAIEASVERAFLRADKDPRIPLERSAREELLRRGLIPWLAGIDSVSQSPRRNIARRSDIPREALPLIELLIEERLLSTDTKEEEGGERVVTIEPAHEALLRQWGLLQGWLQQDFALLATLEGVKRATRDWDANGREEAWLAHQGLRLAEAQTLDQRTDIAAKLDTTDRQYLARCREREERARADAERHRREQEEAQLRRVADAEALRAAGRRTVQRTRIGLAAAILLALVAAGFAVMAKLEKTTAEANEAAARRNQAAALAALSKVALSSEFDPTRAVKFALAAWPRRNDDGIPQLKETVTALGNAVPELRERASYTWGKALLSAAFSPNGLYVVTTSADRKVEVWNTSLGAKPERIFSGQNKCLLAGAFSPDSARVAIASLANAGQISTLATGRSEQPLEHKGTVECATFSPDGTRVVTASSDGSAKLWDAATGSLVKALLHTGAVSDVAFSRDGKRVATASTDKLAKIWDAATGDQIAVLQHFHPVTSVGLSPDGTSVVTVAQDNHARIWLVSEPEKPRHDLPTINTNVSPRAVFSPDGTRILWSDGHTTYRNQKFWVANLWDAKSGSVTMQFGGHQDSLGDHQGPIRDLAFSPDGSRVVTASDDKTARLWDTETGVEIAVFRGHRDAVLTGEFSANGKWVVTASKDGSARVWDAAAGTAALSLHAAGRVFRAVYSPNGKRIVVISKTDNDGYLWDADNRKQITILHGHSQGIASVDFSRDESKILTASADGTARIWRASDGTEIGALPGNCYALKGAVFAPDGLHVVTASVDGIPRLWNTETTQVENPGQSQGSPPLIGATFSRDGATFVSTALDGTVRLWDGRTGKPLRSLIGHTQGVLTAAYSPNGQRIVTASKDGTARVWHVASGTLIRTLAGHTNEVRRAEFSPNGATILTASHDGTARIWDAKTFETLHILKGHDGWVRYAAYSPDGTRVVTSGDDATARLWDPATGQEIISLRGHGRDPDGKADVVEYATFAPDGQHVLTASWDKSARLWDLKAIPPGNIFQIACKLLGDRNISEISTEFGLTNIDPICKADPPWQK